MRFTDISRTICTKMQQDPLNTRGNLLKNMVGAVGIEPTTFGLKVRFCPTNQHTPATRANEISADRQFKEDRFGCFCIQFTDNHTDKNSSSIGREHL